MSEKAKKYALLSLIACLVIGWLLTYVNSQNLQETLDGLKKDHPGILQATETSGNTDEADKAVPSLPTGKPVAVAVAKPAQPQPAQGQAAPVAPRKETTAPTMTAPAENQPLAVQSQPAAAPQTGSQERLEARFNALESRFNALAPCLENMCRVKTDRHAANPTGKKTPGRGKATRLASPPNYNQSAPTRQPAFQGQAPLPTGPVSTNKSCPNGKCISPSNPNAPNLIGGPLY